VTYQVLFNKQRNCELDRQPDLHPWRTGSLKLNLQAKSQSPGTKQLSHGMLNLCVLFLKSQNKAFKFNKHSHSLLLFPSICVSLYSFLPVLLIFFFGIFLPNLFSHNKRMNTRHKRWHKQECFRGRPHYFYVLQDIWLPSFSNKILFYWAYSTL